MKKIYITILVIALSTFNFSLNAQILDDDTDEFIVRKPYFEDFPSKDSDEEFQPDLTFTGDISGALSAHILILNARNKELDEWFGRQHSVFKKEIEKQLNQTFPSYAEARNTYFKHIENRNISRNIGSKRNSYASKVNTKRVVQRKSSRNMRLLDFRQAEIQIGNINNSNFSDFRVNGMAMANVTSLGQLNLLRNEELSLFSGNEWRLTEDNNIYSELLDISNISNLSHGILDKLLIEQLNHYGRYNKWEQLDLMQLYLNNVRIPLVIVTEEIMPQDFATPNFIENYARSDREKYISLSIFHPDFYRDLARQISSNGTTPSHVAETIAQQQTERLREEYLERVLNSITEVDLRTQNLIETLDLVDGSAQANWLNNFEDAANDMYLYLNDPNYNQLRYRHAKKILGILMSNSLSTEQKFEQLLIYENIENPTPSNITQTDLDRFIKEYANQFRRRGDIEFADYLDSLLPIDATSWTQGERWDLINLIKERKVNYTLNLAKEIINVVYESFKPVVEFALWEVGGTATLKLLSKLPVKYLTTPIKNVIARLRAPSSKAFAGLKHAKKFGFRSYDDFVKYFKDNGILRSKYNMEIHHLFEKRLAQSPAIRNFLGSDTGKWKSLLLDKTLEHNPFTGAWLRAIGRVGQKPGWTGFNSNNVTVEAMKRAAREIYKDYPEILKALGL